MDCIIFFSYLTLPVFKDQPETPFAIGWVEIQLLSFSILLLWFSDSFLPFF